MVKDTIYPALKFLLNNLKRRQAVVMASDQVPELSGGEISKFLGKTVFP